MRLMFLHERVDYMLDLEKIKSIIPTSQGIIFSAVFHRDPISAYLKIKNISTKTDYLTSLSVYLINLLLNHSGWLFWELMIVLRVPLWIPFKCWVGNKHVIYCVAMEFFNKFVPNFSWSTFFFSFTKVIFISDNIN